MPPVHVSAPAPTAAYWRPPLAGTLGPSTSQEAIVYSTCLFCQKALGANETLEHFPVGRRIAFDPSKGRLWVVCLGCGRWNLSPIDERWEVLEDCERLFRGTKLRYSTEQIGLARAGDALELVRIGEPLRPEMAAWRYGQVFRRRMRKQIAMGIGATAVAAAYVAMPTAALALGVAGVSGNLLFSLSSLYWQFVHTTQRVPIGNGETVRMTHNQLASVRLNRRKWDWELELPHRVGYGRIVPGMASMVTLRDEAAVGAAAAILPRLNPAVGRRRTVNAAVELLEQAGNADACFRAASRVKTSFFRDGSCTLARLPAPVRLALEMAGHEELEREAMEGELHRLEHAWRQAEEIAAIADTLELPSGVDERLEELRRVR